jgi:hypothetical protein
MRYDYTCLVQCGVFMRTIGIFFTLCNP